MASEGSRTAVVAAFVGNLTVAMAKFVVAGITGRSPMLAEGFHSVADTVNQRLLPQGISGSRSGPSVAHPFGRGKAVHFWSSMVAIALFVGGSGLAIVEGLSAGMAVRRG